MIRLLCFLVIACIASPLIDSAHTAEPARTTADSIDIAADDWPWWRGPERNGIAAADQTPPVAWNEEQNVLWSATVSGRGHSSPTVVGKHIYLATADRNADTQSVVCFDRETGRQLWQTAVHHGGLTKKGNGKSSLASSTVACDGQRLFINFINGGGAYTTSLGLDGKQLWQTRICDYVVHQGYGSSPAIYQSLVIVTADNKAGGAIAALERATGKVVWKLGRPKTPNYSSPILLNVAGKDQLLLTGCDLVSGIEPLSGKKLWEFEGATTECVTSTVTDGNLIITSGGYPKNHLAAVRADGSGKVVWEHKTRVYVPSVLISNGILYGVTDAGVAICHRASNGDELWKQRLGGTFSSSPVLVGSDIYVTNERGKTFIFKANPKKFESIGENQLGNEVFATSTFCDNRIYMRVASSKTGKRQELLYCLGK